MKNNFLPGKKNSLFTEWYGNRIEVGGNDTSTIVCVGRHVGIFDELSQKQKRWP